MFHGKEEKTALILLLMAILIIGGFAVFMETLGTDLIAPSYSVDSGIGTCVKISGFAEEVRNTQAGGHMTASVNGVKVFIPSDIVCSDLVVGDYILVKGIVEDYLGEVEIMAIKIEIKKKTD